MQTKNSILFLSFTNVTARYLSFIEDNFLSSFENIFRISIYPSSHIYYKNIGKDSIPLYKDLNENNFFAAENLQQYEKFISYHNYVSRYFGRHDYSSKLLKEASVMDQILTKIFTNNITHCVLIGDSRMPVELTINHCRKNGSKILFIEQGPFDNMIISQTGVNANWKFEKNFKNLNFNYPIFKSQKFLKYKQLRTFSKYYMLFSDLWYLYGFSNTEFLVGGESFFNHIVKTLKLKLFKSKKIILNKYERHKVVFLPLQMPVDIQGIWHNNDNGDSESIAISLLKSVPKDFILLIREHPFFISKYNKELYELLSNTENALLVNSATLKNCIEISDIVITVNSTVGFEALNLLKQVCLTGNAYYGDLGATHDLEKSEKINWGMINLFLKNKIKTEKIINALGTIKEVLVPGHYLRRNLLISERLKKIIIDFI